MKIYYKMISSKESWLTKDGQIPIEKKIVKATRSSSNTWKSHCKSLLKNSQASTPTSSQLLK